MTKRLKVCIIGNEFYFPIKPRKKTPVNLRHSKVSGTNKYEKDK